MQRQKIGAVRRGGREEGPKVKLARLRNGVASRLRGIAERKGQTAAKGGRVEVAVSEKGSSILLEGRVPSWEDKIALGFYAAKFGYKGVINDIVAADAEWAATETPFDKQAAALSGGADSSRNRPLEGRSFDAAIIGGGVVGCAIARELSKWNISIVLIEKEEDVGTQTSGRNDGMIHDGFAAKPGSKKAKYNVLGNRLWEPLARDLGVPFSRPGSLLVYSSSLIAAAGPALAARAQMNGVDGWEFWSAKRLKAEEPNITDDQHGAFFLPSAGVISPYKATVALAESAAVNGAEIVLGTCVLGFEMQNGGIAKVKTTGGDFIAGVVINAAGNWADVVAGFAGDRFFSLHQRRGVDIILDKSTGATQNHILGMPSLAQAKTHSKGGGLIKTNEGNILVGPTAEEAPGREEYATYPRDMAGLAKHFRINTKISQGMAITYFAGVRPCTYEEDFIIEPSEKVRNLIHAAGIQSPGLASAPAIAADIAEMAVGCLRRTRNVQPRQHFIPRREAAPELRTLSMEERAAIIARDPAYGRIVCRCEEVSEGEIRDALRSPVPAMSLDAVKRRVRPGMGRCHGGFCTPRVMEIISSELGIPLDAVTKKGGNSRIALGETKARGGRL